MEDELNARASPDSGTGSLTDPNYNVINCNSNVPVLEKTSPLSSEDLDNVLSKWRLNKKPSVSQTIQRSLRKNPSVQQNNSKLVSPSKIPSVANRKNATVIGPGSYLDHETLHLPIENRTDSQVFEQQELRSPTTPTNADDRTPSFYSNYETVSPRLLDNRSFENHNTPSVRSRSISGTPSSHTQTFSYRKYSESAGENNGNYAWKSEESGDRKQCRSRTSSLSSELDWGADHEWILLFDNLLRDPLPLHSRGCRCERHCARPAEDEPDRSVATSASKFRASSAPPVRRMGPPPPKVGSTTAGSAAPTTLQRIPSVRKTSAPQVTTGAGALDEEAFIKAFEDVPKGQVFSARELEEQLTNIRTIVGDSNNDWSKRVEALRKVRSLVVAGATSYDEFWQHLRLLETAFQTSIKDLRSQVVREACFTVAYLSQLVENKFDHCAETLLPALINLIPNSAKIMATSGVVTIRFIIRYTHAPRLIPILTSNMTNKSKDIRRTICEFLDQLLHTWPTHSLERHVAALQDAIFKGIKDADSEARAFARKAYGGFAFHFPTQAEALLHSLDVTYQRILHGEIPTLSNSSSSNSLQGVSAGKPSGPASLPLSRPKPPPSGSSENLNRVTPGSLPRRPGMGLYGTKVNGTASPSVRSNSAIDLQAAHRAARNLKIGSVASLPRPRKVEPTTPVSNIASPDRTTRTRARAGSTQSQPSSRSGSPSSRLSYATYTASPGLPPLGSIASPQRPGDSMTLGRRRSSTTARGPRSTGTSREASPSRANTGTPSLYLKGRTRSVSNSSDKAGSPYASGVRPVMAQRILQQSREAENALSDALVTGNVHSPSTRRLGYDDHSDDSETSSVCSERSLDLYNRRASDDVSEIINSCASTHWTDRKEGLSALQVYLRSGRNIPHSEIRRLTEIFSRMFTDAHTKVFSLFLDALSAVIETHHHDMNEWLYVLITRLLNKLGTDLLTSVQTKIYKVLELVRKCFPKDLQLAYILRFLTDAAQTPNIRVKIALLQHLTQLAQLMEPSELSSVTSALSGSGHGSNPGLTLSLAALGVGLGGRGLEPALIKLISWMGDTKSNDVRRSAQDALCALFNAHPAEMTRVLNGLPSACQQGAFQVIQNHMQRSADVAELAATLSPGSSPLRSPPFRFSSPSTPLSHPPTPLTSHPSPSLPGTGQPTPKSRYGRSFDADDTENLNPEDVYKSIRKTTAEIQNYSFDLDMPVKDKPSLEKESSSQESGISQASSGRIGERLDTLGEGREGSCASSTLSSPVGGPRGSVHLERNGIDRALFGLNDEYDKSNEMDDTEAMEKVFDGLASAGENCVQERKDAMKLLMKLLQKGRVELNYDGFRLLLRHLVHAMKDDGADAPTKQMVFGVWSSMISAPHLAQHFTCFMDLILVNIVQSHRNAEKEVCKAAEQCASVVVGVLPVGETVRILGPVVTDTYPENQAAIKVLTSLVEQHSKEAVAPLLPDLMPRLIQACENQESIVRKAAVFCIVALHNLMGQDLQPYLESLNSSRLRLLNVYIQRSQGQKPASPTTDKHSLGT